MADPPEDTLVGPNAQNVLDAPDPVLGIDTARSLDTAPDRWRQFFDIWQSKRKTTGAPAFVARYFGHAHSWKPGEANKLRQSVPTAASIRHIAVFNQPEGYRLAGKSEAGASLKASVVRKHGQDDAKKVGHAIENSKLEQPTSGSLFVFLCLDYLGEAGRTLSPHYWMGWSEALKDYDAGMELLPALYCPYWYASDHAEYKSSIEASDQYQSVKAAFLSKNAPGWDGAKHKCHALATPFPWNYPGYSRSLTLNQSDILAAWPLFDELEQPDLDLTLQQPELGVPNQTEPEPPKNLMAPVVLWQYRINVALMARVGDWTQSGPGPLITSTGTPNGNYRIHVQITKGGVLGVAEFKYSVAKGRKLSGPIATAARCEIPHTGLTLIFSSGQYSADTAYEAVAEISPANGSDGAVFNDPAKVLDIDLLAANPMGYGPSHQPITDFMLRVPD